MLTNEKKAAMHIMAEVRSRHAANEMYLTTLPQANDSSGFDKTA